MPAPFPVALRLTRDTPVQVFDPVRPYLVHDRAQSTFSSAAELIRSVLSDNAPAQRSLPTLAFGPTPSSPESLAQSLQRAVAQSGVFYESHLRAWAEGRHPLKALALEPQAGLAPASAANDEHLAVNDETGPILRQQLDAIENRHIAWNLPPWLGQAATLSISDDGQRGAQQDHERAWQSRVELTLAHLGEFSAEFSLRANRLAVAIDCRRETAAEHMRADLPRLQAKLESAGFPDSELKVSSHASA